MPARRTLGWAGAALLCAAAAASAWWWSRPAPGGVLLITIDTLRADHVGAFGSTRAKTPALDGLAASGIRFTTCSSVCPLTLPSHATILTGLHPATHGVRSNVDFSYDGRSPTLAEILKASGHRTGAVLGASVLNRHGGLDRGFASYDDLTGERGEGQAPIAAELERTAEEVTGRAIHWLRRNARRHRYFLWAHYMDPHAPYAPPAEHAARHPGDPYSAEVEYVDEQVGRLLAKLDDLGLRDATLVVVVSDHGEGLGEHGESKHGFLLYESTLHVPLIVSLPGGRAAGDVVTRPVSIVDVAPTVLDALKLPLVQGMQGRSLLRRTDEGPADIVAETVYGKQAAGFSHLVSLRHDRWKYMLGSCRALHDLESDPAELDDVAEAHPEIASALDTRVRELLASQQAAAAARERERQDSSGDRLEQLRALGYVGGGDVVAADGSLDLEGPCAMARSEFLGRFEEAVEMLFRGDIDRGADMLRELASDEPPNVGVLYNLAVAAQRQGRTDEAETSLRRVLDLAPGHRHAVENLAMILLESGRAFEALQACERSLHADPEAARTWLGKGLALARLGRLDDAEQAIRMASDLAPADVGAVLRLVEVRLALGRPAAAVEAAQRAVDLAPDRAEARRLAARALRAAGDHRAAAREDDVALRLQAESAGP